jgi:hypothetical protein
MKQEIGNHQKRYGNVARDFLYIYEGNWLELR